MTGSFDKPTLVITFDDGYQNNYNVAFPILAEFGCPATIFLATKYIDSEAMPWFCRLHRALTLTTKQSLSWRGAVFDLGDSELKSCSSNALHRSLKRNHPYLIDDLVTEICQKLEVGEQESPVSESPYQMLTSAAIQAMMKSGLIDFGAHTHSHAILGKLSPREQKDEILGSLSLVERLTGRPCRSFAYPNGLRGDYDLSAMRLLKTAGVVSAMSSIAGPNTRTTPALEFQRYSVGSSLNLAEFESIVHHIYHRIKRFSSRTRQAAPTASKGFSKNKLA